MKHLFEKQNKYSIRKFSIGVCSAVIGLSFLSAGTAYAEENATQPAVDNTVATNQPGGPNTDHLEDAELSASELNASENVWTVSETDIPEASTLESDAPVVGETTDTQRIPKANTTRVNVIGASATNERSDFPASQAVDGSVNTAWIGETVDGVKPSLTIELEETAYVNRVNYAALQNGKTVLGSQYHNEAGVIYEGFIEYSTTGNHGDWHRATVTSVGQPHVYNKALNNVAGGSGFQRQGNPSMLGISFTPVEARFLRLTPTKALVGTALPAHENATLFSAGTFLPFAYELTEIEERVTQTLTTDEIHYLDDNTRYKDESEELRAAVAGSRLTVTTYAVENGIKTDRVIGQPVVTETKPQKAVWRRGTLDRPAPVTPV